MKINISNDDISKSDADALITAVNSSRMWFGAMDALIARSVGNNSAHRELSKVIDKLQESEAISVPSGNILCPFKNVIFIVDNLHKELWELLYNAMYVAESSKYNTISLPCIRRGVMKNVVEKSDKEYIEQFVKGISFFVEDCPPDIETLNIFAYNDPKLEQMLKEALL